MLRETLVVNVRAAGVGEEAGVNRAPLYSDTALHFQGTFSSCIFKAYFGLSPEILGQLWAPRS